jgi:hypothetical protein
MQPGDWMRGIRAKRPKIVQNENLPAAAAGRSRCAGIAAHQGGSKQLSLMRACDMTVAATLIRQRHAPLLVSGEL